MSNDFPCICGHSNQYHAKLAPHDQFDCCTRCMVEIPYNLAYYHDYAPDNLRFLEIKSVKKEIQSSPLQDM